MWTQTCFVLVTVGLLLGIASDPTCSLAGDKLTPPTTIQPPPTTIHADEVGQSVSVLGRLGFPLRSVVSVRGIWVELTEEPSKPGSSLWFRVVEISGKRLDKPVQFRRFDLVVLEKDGKTVEPAKGEQWELRAYETWPDYGHPWDFDRELGHPPSAPPPRTDTAGRNPQAA